MDSNMQFTVTTIIGIVAIIVAIIIYLAQRNRKRLAYEIISESSVVSTAEEVEGRIQILFEGKQVKKVHLIILKLANVGNIPITISDYEREVSFAFDEKTRILSYEILETSQEALKPEIESINNSIVVKPVLLNGGDSITIKALISEFDEEIKIDGRIVGVKVIEKRKGNSSMGNILFIVGTTVMTLTITILFFTSDEIGFSSSDFPKENPAAATVILLSMFFAYIGAVVELYRAIRNWIWKFNSPS
jgi:hypothetical protein